MTSRLQVLAGVRWLGEPIPGDRQRRLLIALATAGTSGASAATLAQQVWPEQSVADPSKALQVVVSRARAATAPDVIANTDSGYRLALASDDFDLGVLRLVATSARKTFGDQDWAIAAERGSDALGVVVSADPDSDHAHLHAEALKIQRECRRIRGVSLTHLGQTSDAEPLLEVVHEEEPDDEIAFAALLRCLAKEHSPAQALERYEAHRESLTDRLGVDPSPELQRLHVELLAADRPVREGLRFNASTLVGRDNDISHLEQLVGSGRVTSIVGAGGLGKTRLAQVIAQRSRLPAVHFVELVAVTVDDDVVAEVGSSLGVRDSLVDREKLTAKQRADTRGRIAQHLQGGATLLILDNCEQVVSAVAELVAFLVAVVPELRVLTTTRAPLGIAAERIYQLDELTEEDAVALFSQRAKAVRSSVTLDRDQIAQLVGRLDGLPLAIELAAAQIRVMSLADIARRIDDRFELLRGTDPVAPDRHQTLLNVLEWSWNLITDNERTALAWLSSFHDGFSLLAAERVIDNGHALDSVRGLVDQSLLSVVEDRDGIRYRMLETVREFGRVKLAEVDQTREAQQAYRAWAVETASRAGAFLNSPDQYAGVDQLHAEEGNLTEVLRDAIGDQDGDTVLQIAAPLQMFWSMTGNHGRAHSLNGAIVTFVVTLDIPEQYLESVRLLLAVILQDPLNAGSDHGLLAYQKLSELPARSTDDAVSGVATAALTLLKPELEETPLGRGRLRIVDSSSPELRALLEHQNHTTRLIALIAASHMSENLGDIDTSLEFASAAVEGWEESDGPWFRGVALTLLADAEMQLGRPERALHFASEALPILQRLLAKDDVSQLRSMLVFAALQIGDLARASELLDELDQDESQFMFSTVGMAAVARAELHLSRGEIDDGLKWYVTARDRLAAMRIPGVTGLGGLEPWTVFGDASALTAFSWYGADADVDVLYPRVTEKAQLIFESGSPHIDYPVCGMMLYSIAVAGLRRKTVSVDTCVRLLALADACGFKRWLPSMSWERGRNAVDSEQPDALEAAVAALEGRRGPDVREDVVALLRSDLS